MDASVGAANILRVKWSAKLFLSAAGSTSDCSESPLESAIGGDMKMSAEVNDWVLKLSISSFSVDEASRFFYP